MFQSPDIKNYVNIAIGLVCCTCYCLCRLAAVEVMSDSLVTISDEELHDHASNLISHVMRSLEVCSHFSSSNLILDYVLSYFLKMFALGVLELLPH